MRSYSICNKNFPRLNIIGGSIITLVVGKIFIVHLRKTHWVVIQMLCLEKVKYEIKIAAKENVAIFSLFSSTRTKKVYMPMEKRPNKRGN